MSGAKPELTANSRDVSFETVLDAERSSEQALRACRAEASRIRQAATAEERRIAERTDERLQKLHRANQTRIADTKNALAETFECERRGLAAADAEEIDAAAQRLARMLAGVDVS